ncbi:MAG: site-2 protease family protein [Archaeoglobaceae archaeon]|nr:site-2 protease family protein [Archaeoglobaceae archaeon]MDW7990366.1 site-2 protease family protein [Archaeoglobaceae archaeon]
MLWLLLLFLTYWIAIEILQKRRLLERYGIKNYGPVLLIRTKKGLKTVENVARVRNFWRAFANLGIPFLFLSMFFMLFLIILADFILLISPPKPSELTSPQAALLIPGLNPFIPLIWGFIGLVIAIVVHELAHAILCRVEGIRVKSLGLILALFPIGAFAEPEEKELMDKNTKRISKIRVFSSGVTSNFFVAFLAFTLFFNSLPLLDPVIAVVDDDGKQIGRILDVNGVKISEDFSSSILIRQWNNITIENSTGKHSMAVFGVWGVKVIGLYREGDKIYPAEIAGIERGMLITKMDGKELRNFSEFREEMSKRRPGDSVVVEVYDVKANDFKTINITLVDNNGRAFMGVYLANFDCLGGLNIFDSRSIVSKLIEAPSQLKNPFGWIFLISMPFSFQGFMGLERFFDDPPYLFWLLNSLYWIAWINFYVALFNCLPAIPLDGGRVFQETISGLLRRFGERGERFSIQISRALSIFIFFSIGMMILIPNIDISTMLDK